MKNAAQIDRQRSIGSHGNDKKEEENLQRGKNALLTFKAIELCGMVCTRIRYGKLPPPILFQPGNQNPKKKMAKIIRPITKIIPPTIFQVTAEE
jgi:hypothetical protein